MPASTADVRALAAALLEADRVVVLTGLRLGGPEERDDTHAGGQWAARANLEPLPHRADPLLGITSTPPLGDRGARADPRPPRPRPPAARRGDRRSDHPGGRSPARARGSTDVVEVYGTLLTERCERCGRRYGLPEVGALIAAADDGVPRCTTAGCACPLRPEGTLWGEPLPRPAVERAWQLAAEADALLCSTRTCGPPRSRCCPPSP